MMASLVDARLNTPSRGRCVDLLGLDQGVGHLWLPLGPRHSTAAPQARDVYRLHQDAEGSQGAETVCEARGSPPSVFAWRGVIGGYRLWTISASAGLPIVYGRFRPYTPPSCGVLHSGRRGDRDHFNAQKFSHSTQFSGGAPTPFV